MHKIALDIDTQGIRIMTCQCGATEIGRGLVWSAFRVAPLDNGLAEVTCRVCHTRTRLRHPAPEAGIATLDPADS
ncbi:hypothetical protein QLQ85_12900 [Halomonas sp. M4R5S39]|uniref:hypothetical protein n=1 Tax=Halomonas kalidii TaxID=3043293 RepID=UPI0024A89DFC|nr:hypothetical protein [Halomonas kalidii]MDI5985688.1 hypothetical protein [Halomonas kalidii]